MTDSIGKKITIEEIEGLRMYGYDKKVKAYKLESRPTFSVEYVLRPLYRLKYPEDGKICELFMPPPLRMRNDMIKLFIPKVGEEIILDRQYGKSVYEKVDLTFKVVWVSKRIIQTTRELGLKIKIFLEPLDIGEIQ